MSIKIKIKTCPHCGQLLPPDKYGNFFVDVCNEETAEISHWFGIEKRTVIALSKIKSSLGLSDEEIFEALSEYKYAADFYFSILSNSRKIAARFEKRCERLIKKNKRLREALEIYITALADGLCATGLQDSFWSIVAEADEKVKSLLNDNR